MREKTTATVTNTCTEPLGAGVGEFQAPPDLQGSAPACSRAETAAPSFPAVHLRRSAIPPAQFLWGGGVGGPRPHPDLRLPANAHDLQNDLLPRVAVSGLKTPRLAGRLEAARSVQGDAGPERRPRSLTAVLPVQLGGPRARRLL